MKVLITGSSGHLGEALVRTFQKLKCPIVSVDIKPSKFTTHVGDVSNRKCVKSCMKGVSFVLHTATLHKPHVVTHSKQDFIDTNITGTLNLLEEAVAQNIKSFVFTSTTSTFGDALVPVGNSAVWVTEELTPKPKNIYGATKTAAEDLCQLFSRNHELPCIVLKTSRFFPEEADNKIMRGKYSDNNTKANELLFRRVDIADIVDAHILAINKAKDLGFSKYIISATSPFVQSDLQELSINAARVIDHYFPNFENIYKTKNWRMFPTIGRVYVNEKARKELSWKPQYDFQHVLDCLANGSDYRSELTHLISSKGYHEVEFEEGPFPV